MLMLLLCLVPVTTLVLVYGVVLIVAVCRAKPEDVPQMMAQLTQALRGLFGRLHRRPPTLDHHRGNKELEEEL